MQRKLKHFESSISDFQNMQHRMWSETATKIMNDLNKHAMCDHDTGM